MKMIVDLLKKLRTLVEKNKKSIFSVVVLCVASYLVYMFVMRENFEPYKEEIRQLARESDIAKDKYPQQDNSQKDIPDQQEDAVDNDMEAQKLVNEFEDLQPDELLPRDPEADEWSRVNPKGKGSLELKNFLEAGYHVGVDTQANSLRNANQQLRSEPPNPQKPVSIFLNSTISPDPFRKSMEISGDY
jgi:hypothetical protein